jgi:chaperonin GroES
MGSKKDIIGGQMSTTLRIKPLYNYVIIDMLEEMVEEVTAGGIILTDKAKEIPCIARVTAVGTGPITPDGKPIPMLVKRGDLVLVHRHAPVRWELPGHQEVTAVMEGDIIAILEEVSTDEDEDGQPSKE